MVSPELLRRYPFFAFMNHEQLREVAMIADRVEIAAGEVLFHIDEKADALYLLMTGAIDLRFIVLNEHESDLRKDFHVGNINPGEVVGISAIIEPHRLTATALASTNCQLLKIEAAALHALLYEDEGLSCGLYRQIAKTAMERLNATRVQLAAATSPV